jgi:hypothetical protein
MVIALHVRGCAFLLLLLLLLLQRMLAVLV